MKTIHKNVSVDLMMECTWDELEILKRQYSNNETIFGLIDIPCHFVLTYLKVIDTAVDLSKVYVSATLQMVADK